MRAKIAVTALGAGSAIAAAGQQDVPSHIVAAAKNEVRNGRIVSIYLDPEITTSRVYRVYHGRR
jgi:hypothetical protein